jgi:histidinol-phosphate aminotransferase
VALNRYPDPRCETLRRALREVMAIPDDLELVLGNGSDELIALLIATLAVPGGTVLAPEPSFVMYRLLARGLGAGYLGVPLELPAFGLPAPAMRAAIARHRPVLTFLAYPNNPTGNLFDRAAVESLLEASPGLVVVDEAYAPFAGASLLELVPRYPNLVVMRTLSKLGLAGLRLGFLVAPPAWAAELEKLRLPYNVNVLTQATATFALEHHEVLEAQAARIRADREALTRALADLPGVEVWPSRANFVLLRAPPGRAGTIHTGLRERGILIKCLDGSDPALADCLRVTVGRPEENAALLGALRELLG